MTADGIAEDLAVEYVGHRNKLKAALTPRAWAHIRKEIAKAGMRTEDALSMAMARGWKGFEADWVLKAKPTGSASSNIFAGGL